MKTLSFLGRRLAKPVLAGGLLLTVLAAGPAFADDATNNAEAPAKHSLGLTFDFGNEHAGTNNYFGLPKEAFDRLSPDQILELAKSDQTPPSLAIIVPIAMFSMIAISVALGVNQKMRRNRLLHETLRLMIEKGQPIPPELLQSPDGGRRPRNDLRTGLVLVAVGIGIWLMPLGEVVNHAGFIPLLMGAAFLMVWMIEAKKNGQPK